MQKGLLHQIDKRHLLSNDKNYFCFIDKNVKMVYNSY